MITYAQVGSRVCEYISKGSKKKKTFYPLVWIIEQYKHTIPQTLNLSPRSQATPDSDEPNSEGSNNSLTSMASITKEVIFGTPDHSRPSSVILQPDPTLTPLSLQPCPAVESSRKLTTVNTQVAVAVGGGWSFQQVMVAVLAVAVLQHAMLWVHLTTTTYWTCRN